MRKEGFYWVQHKTQGIIIARFKRKARWEKACWKIVGSKERYTDRDFNWIDSNPIEPEGI